MSDLMRIGLSGLLAFQRSLTTTAHNVANVSTPGYSRQDVNLRASPAEYIGVGYLGTGVETGQVRRIYDGFVSAQVRTYTTTQGQFEMFHALSSQVNNLLGDPNAGLSRELQRFFSAVQGVANDPSSVPARQVMLSAGEGLAERFHSLDRALTDLRDGTNSLLQESVKDVNDLAGAVASLNHQIVLAQGAAGGASPNDLLDRRDALIQQIAGQVTVSTIPQPDGSVSLMIGNGQALVLGDRANSLSLARSTVDPAQMEIAFNSGQSSVVVTRQMSGGKIGGALDFTRQVLDPAQNALGRVAIAVGQSFNAQHREGMTLDGQLGGDFFSLEDPAVVPNTYNTGGAALAVTVSDPGALTTSDYELGFNGANYTLTRLSDRSVQTLSGAGPFVVEGLTIDVSGAANPGDRFLIRPTRGAAAGLQVALTNTSQIAAAAPIRTRASPGNLGGAVISAGEVLDVTDPALLNSLRIQFNNPPDTFDVIDVTTSTTLLSGVAYTSGGDIDVNGLRVQISGNPQAADTFTVERNAGGVGDNRNALLLGALQSKPILEGGTASVGAAYGQLTSNVGSTTRSAETNRDAQAALLAQAQQARDAASGVNLDEEAANLLRFQQLYQAAAQVISVSDSVFQSLIDAVRR